MSVGRLPESRRRGLFLSLVARGRVGQEIGVGLDDMYGYRRNVSATYLVPTRSSVHP